MLPSSNIYFQPRLQCNNNQRCCWRIYLLFVTNIRQEKTNVSKFEHRFPTRTIMADNNTLMLITVLNVGEILSDQAGVSTTLLFTEIRCCQHTCNLNQPSWIEINVSKLPSNLLVINWPAFPRNIGKVLVLHVLTC